MPKLSRGRSLPTLAAVAALAVAPSLHAQDKATGPEPEATEKEKAPAILPVWVQNSAQS